MRDRDHTVTEDLRTEYNNVSYFDRDNTTFQYLKSSSVSNNPEPPQPQIRLSLFKTVNGTSLFAGDQGHAKGTKQDSPRKGSVQAVDR